MSRNKQVDRLVEGLVDINNGQMSESDLKDPVAYALRLVGDQRDEMFTLAQIILEDKEFFEGLHTEMHRAGCREALVISRKGNTDISLAALGWFDRNPKFETREERARLIAINGFVMAHLRDTLIKEIKSNKVSIEQLTKNYNKLCDKLHKTLMDVGIWKDPMCGGFEEMLQIFALSYEKMKQFAADFKKERDDGKELSNVQQNNSKFLLDQRDQQIDEQKRALSDCYKVIEDLTKELKHQTATTKQYKRENGLMRADFINREISGEKL